MFFRSPIRRNQKMVDTLVQEGIIRSREVQEAFLQVPRSLFVPEEEKRRAYDSRAINLIPGTSSISQPQVVATMLEGLQVQKGDRVLEIGSASGYNAALLAQLTGAPERVYTVEVVESLVYRARENLRQAGYSQLSVIHGDGAQGYPPQAPYGRIIITASSPVLPQSLWKQLGEGGRLVLPYNFYQLITLLVGIQKREGQGQGKVFGFPVVFVPLQGAEQQVQGDLSSYQRYVTRGSGEEIMGFSLALIHFYQKWGSVSIPQAKERWRELGCPGGEFFGLQLLENGNLLVKEGQE